MPEVNYDHVVSEIKTLNLTDQLRLLEQMASIIRKKTNTGRTRSILELKGKGKDIWKGVDVKTYLDEERSSWSG
jgi:DNA-binding HxlR family transcriptional regulator